VLVCPSEGQTRLFVVCLMASSHYQRMTRSAWIFPWSREGCEGEHGPCHLTPSLRQKAGHSPVPGSWRCSRRCSPRSTSALPRAPAAAAVTRDPLQ
jgi:hypothetical protein